MPHLSLSIPDGRDQTLTLQLQARALGYALVPAASVRGSF